MTCGPRIFGIVQMRRLDASHSRLGGRMRVFEVVDLVVGDNHTRISYKPVGHAPEPLDLLLRKDVGQDDEPVTTVGGELGLRQHGSSVGPANFPKLLSLGARLVNPLEAAAR